MSADESSKADELADQDKTDEQKSDDLVDEESGESLQADPENSVQPEQMPPATFSEFVAMLSTQAMIALGVIPNPVTEKQDVQLPLAKHFIDLLGILEDKTKGNLSDDEQSLLESTSHGLRMAYMKSTEAAKSS